MQTADKHNNALKSKNEDHPQVHEAFHQKKSEFVNMNMIKDLSFFTILASPPAIVHLVQGSSDIPILSVSAISEALGFFLALAVVDLIIGYVFWLTIKAIIKVFCPKSDYISSPRKIIFLATFLFSIFMIIPFFSSAEEAKNDTKSFFNKEYRFSFKYPTSWHEEPPATPNSIAKVTSPSETPCAECAIIVKKVPVLENLSQVEIDQSLGQSPPNLKEYEASLNQGFSDVSVTSVSQGLLGSRVAHMIRARYSINKGPAKQFVSVRMAKCFSPGYSWSLTCGGKGNSVAEAEKSYEYWQWAINNIFWSFQFD